MLIVDDEEDDAILLIEAMRAGGYDPTYRRVDTRAGMAQALAGASWDIILSDFRMPRFSGIDALSLYNELGLDTPFILVSGTVGEEIAVAIMKAGADDFVMKDRLDRLVLVVDRELRDAAERRTRRQAEAAARASERLAQSTLDALPQHIAVLDRHGVVIAVNAAWRSFARANNLTDPDAGLGANYLEICHRAALAGDTTAALVRAGIEDVLQDRQVAFTIDYPCHSPTEQRWFIMQVHRLQDDEARRLVVVHHDVTGQTRAVLAHRASETRLRAVVDTAPDGILTLDDQGVLTSANPAAERLFGYSMYDLVGMSADRILPGLVARMVLPAAPASVGETPPVPHPAIGGYGLRADGTRFPLEINYGEMHLQGYRQFTCVIHDLTRRRWADEQVARAFSRLAALRRIDLAISGSLNLRLILEIMLDETCRHLAVDAADVLLLNPASYTLEYCAGHGFGTMLARRAAIKLGEGPAGQAALSQQTLSVPDRRQHTGPMPRLEMFEQEQFVFYHVVPLIAKGKVKGVLEIFHRSPFQPDPEWHGFADALAGQAAIAIDNTTLFEDLQRANLDLVLAYDATIEGWSHALDLRDKETEGHSRRVTEMTITLARAMGMSEADLVHVRRGALLHDIGKMGVPDGILLKAGPLSEEEWVVMRRHPTYAFEMLSPIQYLRPALAIPYCHHEKWDGSGYPRGVHGTQIPLEARIFAVIDVWDALTSARPYRAAWTVAQARTHISGQAGSHFDPEVVAAFLRVFGDEIAAGAD
jgi:PAS domain S-box-containing protein/putative nucleotidyltransferase with HDIG domain